MNKYICAWLLRRLLQCSARCTTDNDNTDNNDNHDDDDTDTDSPASFFSLPLDARSTFFSVLTINASSNEPFISVLPDDYH